MAVTLKALFKKSKDSLSRSGKKKLFVIPYFFTFASAIFGLFSVIKTFEGNFVTAAYFILFAGIMDAFDGRLARAFGSSSYLGMELDSLCDAISFCFAPAILLYSWRFDDFGLWGIAVLAFYLCAGLLRLAKFNIATASKPKEIGFFIGLPTTLAALLISLLVINYQWASERIFAFLKHPTAMMLFVGILAFLMVSPVRFLSFKKINPRLSIFGGLILLILLMFSVVHGIPLFFLGLFSYVLSCILFYVFDLGKSFNF